MNELNSLLNTMIYFHLSLATNVSFMEIDPTIKIVAEIVVKFLIYFYFLFGKISFNKQIILILNMLTTKINSLKNLALKSVSKINL